MKSVKAYYNQIFKERFLPLGFEKKGTLFLRKRGDVIQRFQFFKSSYGPLCSVDFGFLPMCMPEDFPLDCCIYRLDEIANCTNYWQYDPNSPESMEKCAQLMADALEDVLMPFFDRCQDCASLIEEERKIRLLELENVEAFLKQRGEKTRSLPDDWFCNSDFCYFAAFKAKNYDYIRRYLTRKKESSQPEDWEYPYRKMLKTHMQWLDSGNFEAFDSVVQENERKMKERIFEFSPKIAKKWFPEL